MSCRAGLGRLVRSPRRDGAAVWGQALRAAHDGLRHPLLLAGQAAFAQGDPEWHRRLRQRECCGLQPAQRRGVASGRVGGGGGRTAHVVQSDRVHLPAGRRRVRPHGGPGGPGERTQGVNFPGGPELAGHHLARGTRLHVRRGDGHGRRARQSAPGQHPAPSSTPPSRHHPHVTLNPVPTLARPSPAARCARWATSAATR